MLDVGSLYARWDDDRLPDLAECCRRANYVHRAPAHEALSDARACVELVRRAIPVTLAEAA